MSINGNKPYLKWFRICLTWLLVSAVAGFILRLMLIVPVNFLEMDYLIHTHSYVSAAGWIYSAFFIAFLYIYGEKCKLNLKNYGILFYITQGIITVLFISSLLQGSGIITGIFSAIFLFITYAFIYFAVKDTMPLYNSAPNYRVELKFFYAGLVFLFISSFGPWGMMLLRAQGLTETEAYTQAINFYYHFLFNGFFTFAIAGILTGLLKEKQSVNLKQANTAFLLMFISSFPAVMLSLTGNSFPGIIKVLAVIAALLQLAGAFTFIKAVNEDSGGRAGLLYRVFITCFLLKFVMQALSAIPLFAKVDFYSRDLFTGYIHLVLIGFITFGILYLFKRFGLFFAEGKLNGWGLWLFLTGFIFSELCLFINGLRLMLAIPVIPYFQGFLLIGALLIMAGVILFAIRTFKKSQ